MTLLRFLQAPEIQFAMCVLGVWIALKLDERQHR